MDAKGRNDQNFHLKWDNNTYTDGSCFITFQNEFFIIGGWKPDDGQSNSRQIAKVDRCRVRNIGKLAFDFSYGSCASMKNSKLYLCFHNEEGNVCRKSNSPMGKFTKIAQSIFDHTYTGIAASEGMGNHSKSI